MRARCSAYGAASDRSCSVAFRFGEALSFATAPFFVHLLIRV